MSSERRSSSLSTQSPSKVARRESPSELLEEQQERQKHQPQREISRPIPYCTDTGADIPVSTQANKVTSAGSSSNDHETATKSKRQRRATGSQDKPPRNQIFYFVDSNSSSREKRAHVMRHHVQEKRRQRKTSNATSESDRAPVQEKHHAPWQTTLEEGRSSVPHESTLHDVPHSGSSVFRAGYLPLKPPVHSLVHIQPPPPAAFPEAPSRAPFGEQLAFLSPEDLALTECWDKITFWSGQNKYLKDHIFRTAMGHPLTFQAVVLAYCARWKAKLYNVTNSIEVQRHVGQAAQGVENALRGIAPVHVDHLAMALIGMALHEERFGQNVVARGYVDQAVQIVRPRAGSNNAVEVFLHYVRYIMTPSTPGFDIEPDGKQWLLTFLRGAEELTLGQNTPAYLFAVPQRLTAFQMDSPLFPLLSSGPRPSQVPLEARMYVLEGKPTQEISRTAALIYITAALWDFQDSLDKTNRFLEQLTAMTREHGLDRSAACETLVWLLLEERWDADLRDAERGWSTGELLKMHKRLRPELQFQFSEILMSFLMMTSPIRGISAFTQDLEVGA